MPQTEPQNPEGAMRQSQHSEAPVAARTSLPALCSMDSPAATRTSCPLSGDARPRAWGHRGPARCSPPGARWFSQGIPALPPTPGKFKHLDFSSEEVTPGLLLGAKPRVSCREKIQFFSSLPFSQVFCKHISFSPLGKC